MDIAMQNVYHRAISKYKKCILVLRLVVVYNIIMMFVAATMGPIPLAVLQLVLAIICVVLIEDLQRKIYRCYEELSK